MCAEKRRFTARDAVLFYTGFSNAFEFTYWADSPGDLLVPYRWRARL